MPDDENTDQTQVAPGVTELTGDISQAQVDEAMRRSAAEQAEDPVAAMARERATSTAQPDAPSLDPAVRRELEAIVDEREQAAPAPAPAPQPQQQRPSSESVLLQRAVEAAIEVCAKEGADNPEHEAELRAHYSRPEARAEMLKILQADAMERARTAATAQVPQQLNEMRNEIRDLKNMVASGGADGGQLSEEEQLAAENTARVMLMAQGIPIHEIDERMTSTMTNGALPGDRKPADWVRMESHILGNVQRYKREYDAARSGGGSAPAGNAPPPFPNTPSGSAPAPRPFDQMGARELEEYVAKNDDREATRYLTKNYDRLLTMQASGSRG